MLRATEAIYEPTRRRDMPVTLRAFTAFAGTLTVVGILALTAPLPATAQSAPPALGQPINEAEIKSFAAAVVEVKRVTDSYMPILAQSRTTEEKDRVEDAAFAEIQQVVESQGFTVPRFNQILAMAHVRPDLVDQIRLHLPQ
jgi:hypothetical protein